MRVEAIRHESLHVMTGYEFVVYRCKIEVRRIAAHAHHLVAMCHAVSWIRNTGDFAAGEKRINQLSLRRLHFQAPHFP